MIKHIDITTDGKFFFVKYYSGTERSYSAEKLPEKARRFLLDRWGHDDKLFSYKLPVFGKGKDYWKIVREQEYYRVVD